MRASSIAIGKRVLFEGGKYEVRRVTPAVKYPARRFVEVGMELIR